jgi:hypothetical protein
MNNFKVSKEATERMRLRVLRIHTQTKSEKVLLEKTKKKTKFILPLEIADQRDFIKRLHIKV